MEPKTKQFRKRNAILTCVKETHLHPSADMVHEMLQPEHPDISLATVYRNLSLFKQQGLIQSVGIVGGIERFDGNTEPHVHFICNECHAILDLPQIPIPEELLSSAATQGGQVESCTLSFTGRCQACCQQKTG
jgi:Fur family peroxide stress response transcriptional regulator